MTHIRSEDPAVIDAQWLRLAKVTQDYIIYHEYAAGLLRSIRSIEALQDAVWARYAIAPELIKALPLWLAALKARNIEATRQLLILEAEMEELKTALNGGED